ncbi:hypothetical protein WA026_002371 [Henosepilachna vigintioctopunctata]|uniref:Uncharacterized protein n=1 Tax=Henosepilachna vigintioctopunctata TaxID=420089 RepID=A0AAW1TR63_9CUCU
MKDSAKGCESVNPESSPLSNVAGCPTLDINIDLGYFNAMPRLAADKYFILKENIEPAIAIEFLLCPFPGFDENLLCPLHGSIGEYIMHHQTEIKALMPSQLHDRAIKPFEYG